MLTSFMVINGYTIWDQRPTSLNAALVNYYSNGNLYNEGVSVPLMLRVRGSMTTSELVDSSPEYVAFFIDGFIDSYFPIESNVVGCSE